MSIRFQTGAPRLQPRKYDSGELAVLAQFYMQRLQDFASVSVCTLASFRQLRSEPIEVPCQGCQFGARGRQGRDVVDTSRALAQHGHVSGQSGDVGPNAEAGAAGSIDDGPGIAATKAKAETDARFAVCLERDARVRVAKMAAVRNGSSRSVGSATARGDISRAQRFASGPPD